MTQSIQTLSKEINKNFSAATIVRVVTTPNQLSRSERAFLKAINFYSSLEKGYCHKAIKYIGAELTQWGAPKCLGPTQSYKIYRKLVSLGLIENTRPDSWGTFETILTPLGRKIYEQVTFEAYNHPLPSNTHQIKMSRTTKVILSENHDCNQEILNNKTRGSVDKSTYYRCKNTGLMRFYDDTIQNLVDDYGFEQVREGLICLNHAKKDPKLIENRIGYLVGILKKRRPQERPMNNRAPTFFDHALSAQERTKNATDRARATLKAQGITYPIRLPGMSTIDFYDATLAYGQSEAALISQYLKPVAQPRPLAINSAPVKPKWGQPYYD